MSPDDARRLQVRADLARGWDVVLRRSAAARSTDASRGKPEAAFVALELDHAYQAFGPLLVRVERVLGLPARMGDTWHRTLLADACRPIEGLRPAVAPLEAESEWAELLAFRHFLRHAYDVELDPARLSVLAERLGRAAAATDPVVRELLEALS